MDKLAAHVTNLLEPHYTRPAPHGSSNDNGVDRVPDGWCVTPRKAEVPRLKPWLWRRTAMISSSRLMLSMHSIRSEYLRMAPACCQSLLCLTCELSLRMPGAESLTPGAESLTEGHVQARSAGAYVSEFMQIRVEPSLVLSPSLWRPLSTARQLHKYLTRHGLLICCSSNGVRDSAARLVSDWLADIYSALCCGDCSGLHCLQQQSRWCKIVACRAAPICHADRV